MSVSAIVSAYYAERFLKKRLDNLMYQNPRPEIIVVCQKGSLEEAIAKTYDVMWIITPDIPTIYAAWNMAIKAANCEYITNANTDDHIYQGSYAAMAKVLNDNSDVAVVYGDENQFDGQQNILKQRPQGDFEMLKTRFFPGPMPMWRASLHMDYGYFDDKFKVCGDYEFWLRIAVHGERFHHIPQALGLYLNRPDSAEHRQKDVAIAEKNYLQTIYKNITIL